MIKILQKEDEVLRKVAKVVDDSLFGSDKLKKILADMSQAMVEQNDAVAIAAPQIGVSLRIFMIAGKIFDENFRRGTGLPKGQTSKHKDLVFINPEILKMSTDKKSVPEACLSVRWLVGKTKRATRAKIEAKDASGQEFVYDASGLIAQIFQHETDHLNGILFIDHAKNIKDEGDKHIKKDEPKRKPKTK